MTLIVALDPPPGAGDPLEWGARIIGETGAAASGFKIGLPLLLKVGLPGLERLASLMPPESLKIADLKLADIGPVMSSAAEAVASAGYDAVIAHGFLGVEGALDELADTCRSLGIKLVVLVSMSHPAASRIMDPLLDTLLEEAIRVDAWGVVAPATRPEIVARTRRRLGPGYIILSPGVGAQGAEPGAALCAGADYEIVGRRITRSPNPREEAFLVLEKQREAVSRCRA